MKIGVIFPQPEVAADSATVRAYAIAVEEMGYSHISAYEHILGVDPGRPEGWDRTKPGSIHDPFLDPFALFSFMAPITTRITFATRILILPQRQTALVAKQAASLDLLSQGRLRLGVGLGWNEAEYIAQNENFGNRAARFEEQISLLRKLWQDPAVDIVGQWHNLHHVGLCPPPVQRPIPIWLGGHADATLRRVARLGDGWMPNDLPPEETRHCIGVLKAYAAESSRAMDDIGIDPRLKVIPDDPGSLRAAVREWQTAGVTHLSLDTMACGFSSPQEHLRALRVSAGILGLPSE